MTREEAVDQLKELKDVPISFGSAPVKLDSLTADDLGNLVGLDIDSIINTLSNILPWIAPFVPWVAPLIPLLPQIKQLVALIQQLLAAFSKDEVKAMLSEAAA